MADLRIQVMLALPIRLEPHRRGVHRLLDHLFVDQRFGIPPLRFRDLELIEECKFHGASWETAICL
jgi:hypothetical protein